MSLRLYDLLPEMFRTADAQQGRPLEALLDTLQIQYDAVEANIDALYDGWFVETCPQWAVPYIAALLGVEGLTTAAANLPRQRGRVGNTQLYRSRKGAMPVLAAAAGDAAGWPAVASDNLDRLVCSQTFRGLRPGRGGSANLRGAETATWIATPFSAAPRTARFRSGDGGPITPANATLDLWRLQAYPLDGVTPAAGPAAGGFFVSPLGVDTPLFTTPQTATDLFRALGPAQTPLRLTALRLQGMVAAARRGEAVTPPFAVHLRDKAGWRTVPLGALAVMDLADWAPPPAQVRWGRRPKEVADIVAAVDPERGRLLVTVDAEAVAVDYAYGFGLDIGGGPYDRRADLARLDDSVWAAVVACDRPERPAPAPQAGVYDSLEAALDAWSRTGRPGVIRIADNATYAWPTGPVALDGTSLTVEAANGCRPCVTGDLTVSAADGARPTLRLSGLWLGGRAVLSGPIDFELVDSALNPAAPGLALALPDGAVAAPPRLHIERSLAGAIAAPIGDEALTVIDSIVAGGGLGSAPGPGPGTLATPPPTPAQVTLQRTTALGPDAFVSSWGPVAAPLGSTLSAEGDAVDWARGVAAARFGEPAFGRPLDRRALAPCATPIGPSGAYHSTLEGQRRHNLAPVADEFLPQQLTLHERFAD